MDEFCKLISGLVGENLQFDEVVSTACDAEAGSRILHSSVLDASEAGTVIRQPHIYVSVGVQDPLHSILIEGVYLPSKDIDEDDEEIAQLRAKLDTPQNVVLDLLQKKLQSDAEFRDSIKNFCQREPLIGANRIAVGISCEKNGNPDIPENAVHFVAIISIFTRVADIVGVNTAPEFPEFTEEELAQQPVRMEAGGSFVRMDSSVLTEDTKLYVLLQPHSSNIVFAGASLYSLESLDGENNDSPSPLVEESESPLDQIGTEVSKINSQGLVTCEVDVKLLQVPIPAVSLTELPEAPLELYGLLPESTLRVTYRAPLPPAFTPILDVGTDAYSSGPEGATMLSIPIGQYLESAPVALHYGLEIRAGPEGEASSLLNCVLTLLAADGNGDDFLPRLDDDSVEIASGPIYGAVFLAERSTLIPGEYRALSLPMLFSGSNDVKPLSLVLSEVPQAEMDEDTIPITHMMLITAEDFSSAVAQALDFGYTELVSLLSTPYPCTIYGGNLQGGTEADVNLAPWLTRFLRDPSDVADDATSSRPLTPPVVLLGIQRARGQKPVLHVALHSLLVMRGKVPDLAAPVGYTSQIVDVGLLSKRQGKRVKLALKDSTDFEDDESEGSANEDEPESDKALDEGKGDSEDEKDDLDSDEEELDSTDPSPIRTFRLCLLHSNQEMAIDALIEGGGLSVLVAKSRPSTGKDWMSDDDTEPLSPDAFVDTTIDFSAYKGLNRAPSVRIIPPIGRKEGLPIELESRDTLLARIAAERERRMRLDQEKQKLDSILSVFLDLRGGGGPQSIPAMQNTAYAYGATDKQRKWAEGVDAIMRERIRLAKEQSTYDARAMELQKQLDKKEANLLAAESALLKYKREVCSAAIHSHTSIKMSKSLMEQYLDEGAVRNALLAKVQLRCILAEASLKKLTEQVNVKEKLSEGLGSADLEQLKLESSSLGSRIEDRNDELAKLKKKLQSVVQVLTHIREKLHFVSAESAELREKLDVIEKEVDSHRANLTIEKRQRETLRQANEVARRAQGFAFQDSLAKDYGARENRVFEGKQVLAQMEALLEFLKGLATNMEEQVADAL